MDPEGEAPAWKARRKFWMKPLLKTNLAVVRADDIDDNDDDDDGYYYYYYYLLLLLLFLWVHPKRFFDWYI